MKLGPEISLGKTINPNWKLCCYPHLLRSHHREISLFLGCDPMCADLWQQVTGNANSCSTIYLYTYYGFWGRLKYWFTLFFNVTIFSYYPYSHKGQKIERYCTNEHYWRHILRDRRKFGRTPENTCLLCTSSMEWLSPKMGGSGWSRFRLRFRFQPEILIPTPIPTPLSINYMTPIPVPIPAIVTPVPIPVPIPW